MGCFGKSNNFFGLKWVIMIIIISYILKCQGIQIENFVFNQSLTREVRFILEYLYKDHL